MRSPHWQFTQRMARPTGLIFLSATALSSIVAADGAHGALRDK